MGLKVRQSKPVSSGGWEPIVVLDAVAHHIRGSPSIQICPPLWSLCLWDTCEMCDVGVEGSEGKKAAFPPFKIHFLVSRSLILIPIRDHLIGSEYYASSFLKVDSNMDSSQTQFLTHFAIFEQWFHTLPWKKEPITGVIGRNLQRLILRACWLSRTTCSCFIF